MLRWGTEQRKETNLSASRFSTLRFLNICPWIPILRSTPRNEKRKTVAALAQVGHEALARPGALPSFSASMPRMSDALS